MTEESRKIEHYDGKEVADSLGRKITFRKPTIMDKYYLNRALGADSDIGTCLGMMAPLLYVGKIDGVIFVTPKTYQECTVGLNRLGEEGVQAVYANVFESIATEKEEIASIKK